MLPGRPFYTARFLRPRRESTVTQQEIDSLSPPEGPMPSDVMRSAVATGFAAAVLPVVAQTVIQTDSTGPVSYTHLDVYKRQGQPRAPRPADGGGAGSQTANAPGLGARRHGGGPAARLSLIHI